MYEETATIPQETIRITSLKRYRGILDILVGFTPILILGSAGTLLGTDTNTGGILVNLGYVLSIIIAGKLLRLRGSGWREVGLAPPKSWRRTVLLGIGTFAAAVIVSVIVQVIALNLPGAMVEPIDESRFNPLEGNLAYFLLMLTLAWTTIPFGEEMFFRAFMINRLGEVFQNYKWRWTVALILSSIVFGIVHIVEGPLGMMYTAAFGLVLGTVYLLSGRNLWITIIAHGLANTLRYALLYLGMS